MSNDVPSRSTLLKPKKDAEFDDEYETIIPTEGEVRVVGNKNRECQYYYIGIEQCRKKMLFLAGDPSKKNHELGFLPCKRIVDAHYRCLTDEKYGYTLEDAPDVTKIASHEFFQCTFKNLEPMAHCRRYIDEVLRQIYRQPGSKLTDY